MILQTNTPSFTGGEIAPCVFFFVSPCSLQCAVHKVAIPSAIRPISLRFLRYIRSTPGVVLLHFCCFVFAPRQQFRYRNNGLCSLLVFFFIVHIGFCSPACSLPPRQSLPSGTLNQTNLDRQCRFGVPPHSTLYPRESPFLRRSSVPTTPLSHTISTRCQFCSIACAAGSHSSFPLHLPSAPLLLLNPRLYNRVFLTGTYIFVDQ